MDRDSVDASKVKNDYRQTLLRLCHEHSNTKIAWDVSQQVLDKIWKDDENSSKKNTGSSSSSSAMKTYTTGVAVASAASQGGSESYNYACQACGFGLHPGWQGTTLRVKRPVEFSSAAAKKTVRRREQLKRKKAALAEKRNRKSKEYHKQRRLLEQQQQQQAATLSSTTADGATQKTVLLRDDTEGTGPLDRNRLVLTCGRCQDKTLLKGMRQELVSTQPPKAKRRSAKKALYPQAGSNTFGGADFEKLPKLSNSNKNNMNKKKPPPPPSYYSPAAAAAKKRAPPASSMTPLEQRMGRKKKKKPAGGGGDLLNFLSTLNDH